MLRMYSSSSLFFSSQEEGWTPAAMPSEIQVARVNVSQMLLETHVNEDLKLNYE